MGISTNLMGEMLQYCEDAPSPEFLLTSPSTRYGQRITPSHPEGDIADISVYLSVDGVVDGAYRFKLSLWRFDGSMPTSMFYEQEKTGSPYYLQWRSFPVNIHWTGDGETEFIVAVQPMQNGLPNPLYTQFHMDDQFLPPNRNWSKQGSNSWQLTSNSGDILIKVHFCNSNAVQPSSVGFLKATFR